MSSRPLDPNLASILDSIRATVGGDAVPEAEPIAAEPDEAPEPAAVRAQAAKAAVRKAVPPAQRSVEEFLAELIRPQVETWLAAHLPEIIQKMAADEIARLTGKK